MNDTPSPIIVDRLKFRTRTQRNVQIHRCPIVDVYHHQIVVAISLTTPEVAFLAENASRFPAVLDTGFNDNLLITEHHLREWADIPLDQLEKKQDVDDGIALHEGKIWMHRNVTLSRTEYLNESPFPIELKRGIFLARDDRGSRLPILGMKAPSDAQLIVTIDTVEEHVTIQRKEPAARIAGAE